MLDTAANADLRECRVLLIDGERSAREIVVRMLASMGISKVTSVANAETGWSYLVGEKSKPFHAVITELNLPGIGGNTLIKKIRELPSPRCKTLPFIVLSGSSDLDDYKKVGGYGISRYLVKPFSAALLRTAIEAAVLRQTAARDVR